MRILKEISKYIDEELHDSEKYIKKALELKESDNDTAEMYYKLSLAEMDHVNLLHTQGVKIINKYKDSGNVVPETMQAVFDYLHEQHIDRANTIKIYQSQYR